MNPGFFKGKEILYLCVVTKQNTINVLPFPALRESATKILVGALCSPQAYKDWYPSLIQYFGDTRIHPASYAEDVTPWQNAELLFNALASAFTDFFGTESANKVVIINYGGGQKYLTPALIMLIRKFSTSANYFVYPDKGSNKIYWDEFTIGEPGVHAINDIAFSEPLIKLIRLFTEDLIRSKLQLWPNQVNRQHQSIEHLPDLYQEPEYTDFLYSTREDTQISLADIITDYKDKNNFRELVNENLVEVLNKQLLRHRVQLSLKEGRISASTEMELISANQWLQITASSITWTKKLLLSGGFISNMKPVPRTFTIKNENLWRKGSTGYPLHDNIRDGILTIDLYSMKRLFADCAPDLSITGHALYFELIVSQRIIQWARANSGVLNEAHWSYQFINKLTGMDVAEFDIVLYTRKASIIVLECKSFNFDNNDFLSSYFKAREYGGVYTDYHVVFPPLPSMQTLREKAIENLRKMHIQIKRQQGMKMLMYDAVQCKNFQVEEMLIQSLSSYLEEVTVKR